MPNKLLNSRVHQRTHSIRRVNRESGNFRQIADPLYLHGALVTLLQLVDEGVEAAILCDDVELDPGYRARQLARIKGDKKVESVCTFPSYAHIPRGCPFAAWRLPY